MPGIFGTFAATQSVRFWGVCGAVVCVHALLAVVTWKTAKPETEDHPFAAIEVIQPLSTGSMNTKFQLEPQKSSHKNDVLKPNRQAAPAQPARPQPTVNQTPGPGDTQPAQSAVSLETRSVEQTTLSSSKAVATPPSTTLAEAPPQVELPSKDAQYLHHAVPDYPAISQRLNEQGKVMVRVLISSAGEPLRVEVHESSGFDRLDRSALQAVKGWRFVPGRKQGVAQDMWFTVPVNFQLTH